MLGRAFGWQLANAGQRWKKESASSPGDPAGAFCCMVQFVDRMRHACKAVTVRKPLILATLTVGSSCVDEKLGQAVPARATARKR